MDGPPPQRWDRSKWITVFSSHSPTIREVTECLGLGLSPSASTTNRGIPKFDAQEFKTLSAAVTRLSKELPQDRESLLDFAADPNALRKELDDLLERDDLGLKIWGKEADRSRLVRPDPEKKTYYKDLFYEDPEDREVLKIHLQRWIVIKACYWIRNRKLKKHSAGEEYETLADIDGGSPATKPELQSPVATPQSGTPPAPKEPTSAEGSEQPLNLRKRKSSVFTSLSDEEDVNTPYGSKKRAYHTLPLQRKSPRKSLSGVRLSSNENLPPSPTPTTIHLQPPISNNTPPSDSGRPLLSPLSNNALNGAARPPNPSSFAAVNGPTAPASTPPSSFAAVNASSATANSPPNFAAVNGPSASINAPATAASPSTFAPVNAHNATSTATPSSFAPVNASSGFTAVNVAHAVSAPPTATPSSSNVAIAPNPRTYSSPYVASGAQGGPDAPQMPNGHSTIHPHGPHSQTPPTHKRELSPQKNVNAYREPETHAIPAPQTTNTPPAPPNAHYNAHGMQQSFHTHSIPNAPAPGVSNFQPKFHGHPAPSTNGHAIAPTPILPSNATSYPHTNGHNYEQRTTSRAPSPLDTTLLQCELLGLMMRYFFPREGPRLDETILLQNLEYIWAQNEGPFHKTMGHLFDLQAKILYSWMEERRKISQLQHVMEGQPGVRAPEMVDRLLAMNDLRMMRLKWKALKTQDGNQTLSPEDLLCRTFATMTKTEGTEHLFKEGLERLNESVFEFLRSEDMKISMRKA